MKMSSKGTMLTATVLLTLSSGTAYAATPGTVDSQELFNANRLVTDPEQKPAIEENTAMDRYEASISSQKKAVKAASTTTSVKTAQPAHLRWESVDARLAARNNDPSFNLSTQKPKPIIITAEDIRREEKLAAKEGRPVRELVGDVNMNRPVPPPRPKRLISSADGQTSVDQSDADVSTRADMESDHDTHVPAQSSAQSGGRTASRTDWQNPVQTTGGVYVPSGASGQQSAAQNPATSNGMNTAPSASERQFSMQTSPSGRSADAYSSSASDLRSGVQSTASGQRGSIQQDPGMSQTNAPYSAAGIQAGSMEQNSSVFPSVTAGDAVGAQDRPVRPRYPQMPQETFSLTPPAENSTTPKDSSSIYSPTVPPIKDHTPVVEHSIRPEGVPELASRPLRNSDADLAGISDEVRRHILAGQLAMEVQLQRDPSVAGMRAITKVLRENTTLTRLQKIDFLIGFGRALHRSGLPRQQEALLIKTIAESF